MKLFLSKFVSCSLLILSLAGTAGADLKWPSVTNETKPWTRWWWLGSIANEKDMTVEMEKYARAGLGGLEITPIYGVRGREKDFRNYLTPEWMQIFTHSLKEGKRLGMGIDMATGNGWPFGGPWVDEADACKNVVYKTYTLNGGEQLREAIQFIQPPMLRGIGVRGVQISALKQPLRANDNLQALAPEQVRFEKPLPLVALMAYSEKGQTQNLLDKVDSAGNLNWTAPEGKWALYAVFQGLHGKLVERAGPGGEGDVIDHFSSKALVNYLRPFDQALAKVDTSGLRAYFNDSYEVDDATGDSNWTPEFFAHFQKLRGYDLREHLPALFGKDSAEKNARVVSDYRETLSDLLLTEFTQPWSRWAKTKGAITRNQAHGSPANILDLYAASGIPETEGDDILKFKFASSAAHVSGKRLASAEAATWLGEHFTSTLGDVKKAVDLFFLGGINHICYHGTPYSPASEAWPGWMFYAAVHFGTTNSFWNDFPLLNQYVTRAQSFLQAGRSDNDVLLYYPIYDSYAEPGRRPLQHFDGGAQGTGARVAGEQMHAAGFAFDFVSDLQLSGAKANGTGVNLGGLTFKTIVLPRAKYIPLSTFENLVNLAKSGATVVVHGQMPEDIAGFAQLEARRKAYRALVESIRFTAAAGSPVKSASVGKGRFLMGEDLRQLLAQSGIEREELVDQGLQFVRRKLSEGHAYFVLNTSAKPVDGWVRFARTGRSAGIFDLLGGNSGLAATRKEGGRDQVYLQLEPGESVVVQSFDAVVKSQMFSYWKPGGAAQPVQGEWTVTFTTGGPTLPAAVKRNALESWTSFDTPGVQSFSGTAVYSVNFPRPQGNAGSFYLDLGTVHESARVTLNGKEIGGLIQKPYRLRIPAAALQAQNKLEIAVSNLMANRIIEMEKQGVNYRNFYNINFPARLGENRGPGGLFSAAKWAPRPSGLIGPVTLTPVEAMRF